jgi:hypothetical protein
VAGNPTVTSNATSANTASTIVARDASGNFAAGTIVANLEGVVTAAAGSVAVTQTAGDNSTKIATTAFVTTAAAAVAQAANDASLAYAIALG